MPELPEVEAARRAIAAHCVGKRIVRAVVADDPKVIVNVNVISTSIVGKTIVSALRKGKNLWLRLDSPPFPSFQFGMAGAFYIKGVPLPQYTRSEVGPDDEWPSKYSKLLMELDDGLELSFTDKRRFARVRLLEDPTSVPPISELGPDALLEPMSLDDFVDSLRKKKIGIKALLLDQSYISGIGNWIADEVLYQARIHPLQIASELSRERCELLHGRIKEVLEKAVEVSADSSKYPSNWIFHSREKKPGKAYVDGMKIEFITAGGRTSAFVPELQRLSGSQSVKKSGGSKTRKPSMNASKSKESDTEDEVMEKESTDEDEDGDESVEEDANIVKSKTRKNGRGRPKKTVEKSEQPAKSKVGTSKKSELQRKKARKK